MYFVSVKLMVSFNLIFCFFKKYFFSGVDVEEDKRDDKFKRSTAWGANVAVSSSKNVNIPQLEHVVDLEFPKLELRLFLGLTLFQFVWIKNMNLLDSTLQLAMSNIVIITLLQ